MGGEVEGRVVLRAGREEGRVREAHEGVGRRVREAGERGRRERREGRRSQGGGVRQEVVVAQLGGARGRGPLLVGVVVVVGRQRGRLVVGLLVVVVVLVVGVVVGRGGGGVGGRGCGRGGREGVEQRLDGAQDVPAAAQQDRLQHLHLPAGEQPHEGLHAGQLGRVGRPRRGRGRTGALVLVVGVPASSLAGSRLVVLAGGVAARAGQGWRRRGLCGRGRGRGLGGGGRRRHLQAEGLVADRRGRRVAAGVVVVARPLRSCWGDNKGQSEGGLAMPRKPNHTHTHRQTD